MTDAAPKHKQIYEFFAMSRRLTEARSSSLGELGFAECELGFASLADAHQLANSRAGRDTALLLYRGAVRLLLRAELRRRQLGAADEPWTETWAAAKELEVLTGSKAAPLLEPVLASEGGEARLAQLGSRERDQVLQELSTLAQRLADGLSPSASRVRHVLWTRRFRLLALALVAMVVVGWSVRKLAAPNNLALNRPVVVTDSDPQYGVDPRRVVDGDDLNLGFHTSYQPKASVTIDLGSVKPLKRAVVFNRIDCCQERATPLSLELSQDGKHFTVVAQRRQRFQQWRVAMPAGSNARYVRLVHGTPGIFHLAEIEVF
jgi:hypothetical protein